MLIETVQAPIHRYGIGPRYEKLKVLTRGRTNDQTTLAILVGLELPEAVRADLLALTGL